MALDFPNAPTLNQRYSASGRTWEFNGVGWASVAVVKGEQGIQGIPGEIGPSGGVPGADGATGASAYEFAVSEGFEGTEQEWLGQLGSTLVNSHRADLTPHPAYDDLPSLNLLFENGLI